MAHGNDIIHNNHYHKQWQRRVRTWFNQPARKTRRQNARKDKAAKIAPRPVHGPIRPIVNCPTFRYNMKVREGRGFSLMELKKAGIPKKYARTIGISVDPRRKNASKRNMNRNVRRLKAYQGKLVVLPMHKKSEAKKLLQAKEPFKAVYQPKPQMPAHVITEDEKKYQAFHAMRQLRAQKQLLGKRIRLRTAKDD